MSSGAAKVQPGASAVQSEPPFALTQVLVLALFGWLGVVAVKGFRPRLVG